MWVRSEMPERGERLAEASVAWEVERGEEGPLNYQDTPLLIGVDPYGHTVFNWLQVQRQLPREIKHLRATLADLKSATMLDELERLISVASEGPSEGRGRYLWFLGD